MEKKKTAMQELIEFIEVMKTNQTLLNGCEITTVHIPSLLYKATELLDLEREQIEEAWNAGDDEANRAQDTCYDYYSTTFSKQ